MTQFNDVTIVLYVHHLGMAFLYHMAEMPDEAPVTTKTTSVDSYTSHISRKGA